MYCFVGQESNIAGSGLNPASAVFFEKTRKCRGCWQSLFIRRSNSRNINVILFSFAYL
jgi:hypothetical protein